MLIMSLSHKRPSGFTIVELLIVIVVIGILAAITIVAYNGVTTRAQNAKVISLARQYIDIFDQYNLDNGRYPQAETEYVCLPGNFPAKDGFPLGSCEINGLGGDAAKQTTISNNNPGEELKAYFPSLPDSSYGAVVTGTSGWIYSGSKVRGLMYTDDGIPHLLYHLVKTSHCPMGVVDTAPGSNGIVCNYYFQ